MDIPDELMDIITSSKEKYSTKESNDGINVSLEKDEIIRDPILEILSTQSCPKTSSNRQSNLSQNKFQVPAKIKQYIQSQRLEERNTDQDVEFSNSDQLDDF